MANFAELRRNMVDCQLRPSNITDLKLLDAMNSVPREQFLPDALQALAYADQEVDLIAGHQTARRSMLTPIALATLIQLADIQPTDFVLDVGCQTGYSAAVLSHLADSVVALEQNSDLNTTAGNVLRHLLVDNVAVVEGPLSAGQADQGPFDVILINGSVELVPDVLLEQLKDGGRLVTVVKRDGFGRATRYLKSGEVIGSIDFSDLSAPALAGFEVAPEFAL